MVQDHDTHRNLLAEIAAISASEPTLRRRRFKSFAKEIAAHAAAEEQALWSSVLRHPDATKDARHAIAEHKEIDEMVADLAARDPGTRAWTLRFGKLREKYLHHIKEEEHEQFIASESVLDPSERRRMKSFFSRRKSIERSEARIAKKIELKEF